MSRRPRAIALATLLLALAACGADGPPRPPEVDVNGEARVGVVITP